MGLDMYLEREHYIGGNFEHREVTGTIDIRMKGVQIPIQLNKVSTIVEQVGYWRKANQIHKWFVDNVQSGKDDCRRYWVGWHMLMDLRELCQRAIAEKNPRLLPPCSGFFFGGTDINDYYWDDLKRTVELIDSLKSPKEIAGNSSYYYQSSW